MIRRKNLKNLLPGLPLLAIAFIPFSEMEVWRRVVVLVLLAATYYAMTKMERAK